MGEFWYIFFFLFWMMGIRYHHAYLFLILSVMFFLF